MQSLPAQQGMTDTSAQQIAAAASSGSEAKTLWMGQIPAGWDEAYVSSLLEPVAKPVTLKLLKYPGTPTCFAFIDFATHEDAQKVLQTLGNQRIPGTNTTFRLNWGAGNNRRSFANPNEFSLFVGDLPLEVSDGMLFEAFASRFPACSSAKVVMDAYTNTSKGYGFVRFTDKSQCDTAIATMNGMMIAGRQVRVSQATAPTRRNSPFSNGGAMMPPGQMPGVSGMQYPYGIPQFAVASDPRTTVGYRSPRELNGAPLLTSARTSEESISSPDLSTLVGGLAPPDVSSMSLNSVSYGSVPRPGENTTVFVGNLDPAVSEIQLQQHFQGFGNIVQVKIPPNRGCGFVKYDSYESAEKALGALNGSLLGGQRVRLDWGKTSANRLQQAAMMAVSSTLDPSMTGYYNPYYVQQWPSQPMYYTRYPTQYVVPQHLPAGNQSYNVSGMTMIQPGQSTGERMQDDSGIDMQEYASPEIAAVMQQQQQLMAKGSENTDKP